MAHVRSWDLLKGKTAREITQSQVEQVGGSTFVQSEEKNALRQWTSIGDITSTLAFAGGALPHPDSIVLYEAAAPSGGTGTVKPSDIFSTEPNAGGYVCVLLGGSIQGTSDNIVVTPKLYDGAVTVDLCKSSAAGPATQVTMNLNENTSSAPIYFTEDTYLAFTESGGASIAKIYLRVGICVRGGNPQ